MPQNPKGSISSIDDIEQHDELHSEKEDDELEGDEVIIGLKKNQLSIDVTKALMVLGFSSWSNLEEGVERNNPIEMQTKLKNVMEKRRKDRREFRALMKATKALNFDLQWVYVKGCSQIWTKPNPNVLQVPKPSLNVLQVPNQIVSDNDDYDDSCKEVVNVPNVPKSPRRSPKRTPKNKKRYPKRSKKVAHGTKSLPHEHIFEDDKVDESDKEEEDAFNWAHSVLLKEFDRRSDMRHQNKVSSNRAKNKLLAFQKFKRLQEEQWKKEANERAKGETIYKATESNKPKSETNTSMADNANMNDRNLDPDVSRENSTTQNNAEVNDEELSNHRIQILSLQDQIRKEKERSHFSMVSEVFHCDTEKEKMKEAEKVLRRLNNTAELKKQKERIAQLRKVLSLKKAKEHDVANNGEKVESKEENDKNFTPMEELKALEAKANAVKTMWKKKPISKSSFKNTQKDSRKRATKSLESESGNAEKPSKMLQNMELQMAQKSENEEAQKFEKFVKNQVKQQGIVLTKEEEKMVQDAIYGNTLSETKDGGFDSELQMAQKSENEEAQKFEKFVQNQVKQQGIVLTKEEEKMVQDAIAKHLSESQESGFDLEYSDDEVINEVFE